MEPINTKKKVIIAKLPYSNHNNAKNALQVENQVGCILVSLVENIWQT